MALFVDVDSSGKRRWNVKEELLDLDDDQWMMLLNVLVFVVFVVVFVVALSFLFLVLEEEDDEVLPGFGSARGRLEARAISLLGPPSPFLFWVTLTCS